MKIKGTLEAVRSSASMTAFTKVLLIVSKSSPEDATKTGLHSHAFCTSAVVKIKGILDVVVRSSVSTTSFMGMLLSESNSYASEDVGKVRKRDYIPARFAMVMM